MSSKENSSVPTIYEQYFSIIYINGRWCEVRLIVIVEEPIFVVKVFDHYRVATFKISLISMFHELFTADENYSVRINSFQDFSIHEHNICINETPCLVIIF